MPNDIKVQDSNPIDENLRPLSVGGEKTSLEISNSNGARVTGDLEVTGNIKGNVSDITFDDIICDSVTADDFFISTRGQLIYDGTSVKLEALSPSDVDKHLKLIAAKDIEIDYGAGDELVFKEDGDITATLGAETFRLFESAGGTDSFSILVSSNGATTIATSDAAGTAANLGIYADGSLSLNSFGYLGTGGYAEADSKNITLTPGASVVIDKNRSETAAMTISALKIDLDKTGASTTNNTIYGLNIDVDNTTATNGTNTMYGFSCTPTLTHAANFGTAIVYGGQIVATGGTSGTGTAIGLDLQATGADTNIQLKLTANSDDYATFHCADTGDLTIATIGDGTTDSDLLLDADGDIVLDSATGVVDFTDNGAAAGRILSTAGSTKLMGIPTNHAIKLESKGTGNVTLDSSGDIIIDSADGNFILKKANVEFSVANSAYAGMILGYTVDGINQTPATYPLTTSNALVASGTHHVSFIAPPSRVVEIEVQINYDAGSLAQTLKLGLSDHTSLISNSLGTYFIQQVYEAGRAINDMNVINKWIATGLTAGDTYKWYLTAYVNSTSGSPTLQWGGDSISENPVFIMKATALPTEVADFAVYG